MSNFPKVEEAPVQNIPAVVFCQYHNVWGLETLPRVLYPVFFVADIQQKHRGPAFQMEFGSKQAWQFLKQNLFPVEFFLGGSLDIPPMDARDMI